MTRSLTLARLPQAGANSKPHLYKKVQKAPSKNHLKTSDKEKEQKLFSYHWRTKQRNRKTLEAKTKHGPRNQGIIN